MVLLTERAVISRGLRYRAMGWMYCHTDPVSMLKTVLKIKTAGHYPLLHSKLNSRKTTFIVIDTELTD